MKTIQQMIDEIRSRERAELRDALINKGKKVGNGYEYEFGPECPIIAAYYGDEPCDVVILAVRVGNDGDLTIKGDAKYGRGNEFELDPDDIFAGQLDYVISEIQ